MGAWTAGPGFRTHCRGRRLTLLAVLTVFSSDARFLITLSGSAFEPTRTHGS
jgi:hypothetical protein